ncbi:entericidin [Rhizobium sp. DKSPLA3]|uniref:Entericidin n=1 Tax=Rhizobium quercicola TaxID=2901226 RepID=A0A9X1NX07_9HYPH|nr:entericidin [Rhizobium quercicola]MCD7110868.1 entericidin [Rhizobium quercicola]
MRPILIAILGVAALTLAGCGNTANGLKRDGQDTSRALDNASHRVLSQSGR